MTKVVEWTLPIRTVSEANLGGEHWTKKSKRHKIQKKWIWAQFQKEKPVITLPAHVMLTRIAPRSLDSHDNLISSFKYLVDGIAENILPGQAAGRADDSMQLSWEFRQEKGKPKQYAVRIEIQTKEI